VKSLLVGICVVICALAGGTPGTARAGDDPLFPLIVAEDWSALQKAARQRLDADPLDGIALHALGRMAVDGDVGTEQQREALLPQIRACLTARPHDAFCHLAYGQVAGAQLKSLSMFDALDSVDKVTDAFVAAVADDPSDYDARESLVTFYIRAPGIVGGSMRKAYRNADAYAKINPDYARLLYALIALEEDDLSKAEDQLAKLPEDPSDPVLAQLTAKRWLALGIAYLGTNDYGAAQVALTRALAHGAPSVVAKSRQALDHMPQVRPMADNDQGSPGTY
jgi:tetratricopeptide (TPR) repeat protein